MPNQPPSTLHTLPSEPLRTFHNYTLSYTFALGLRGVKRPLPEVAFKGEQELLAAPEDLCKRKKKKRKSESNLSLLTFKNDTRHNSQYCQELEMEWLT